MKIEIPSTIPANFTEQWPGQYDVFSHYEDILGIPHVLFLITTLKENRKPNVSFGGWSSFSGDKGGFFALISMMQKSHTFQNIIRDKEFCVNFIDYRYRENCWSTVKNNDYSSDEIEIGGFHKEQSKIIKPPRLIEAFMSLECSFVSSQDVSGAGINQLVIGKVVHAAIDMDYINGMTKYSDNGFMLYFYEMFQHQNGNSGKRRYSTLSSID